MKLRRVLPSLFFLFFLAAACSKNRISPPAAPLDEGETRQDSAVPVPAWPALALLQTGENPLWFELGAEGPELIESPSAASLAPFAPWPRARFISGMESWGGSLVMAVNRDGFLAASPGDEPGKAALYRAAAPGQWEPYTVASLFFHESEPAVLLYRDDFFVSPEAPIAEPQVVILRKDQASPLGVRLPALEVLPAEEGWEVNSLRRGSDGSWYYRFVQTGRPQPGIAYYRTRNFFGEGESVSLADYRNSSKPGNAASGPPFAAELLAKAGEYFPGLEGTPVLRLLFSEAAADSGTRLFSARPDAEEEFFLLFGYYRNAPSWSGRAETEAPLRGEASAAGESPLGFAFMPSGRGVAFKDGAFFSFSLPPLPEGFVYTAAGLAGKVLIAAWEEQDGFLIGAAGFMALDAETPDLYRPIQ